MLLWCGLKKGWKMDEIIGFIKFVLYIFVVLLIGCGILALLLWFGMWAMKHIIGLPLLILLAAIMIGIEVYFKK
jgi:hypothetical protein